jgi:hypothetical protein
MHSFYTEDYAGGFNDTSHDDEVKHTEEPLDPGLVGADAHFPQPRKHLMRLNTSPDIIPLLNRRRSFSKRSLSVGEFASQKKTSGESYYNCSPMGTDERDSMCQSLISDRDPASMDDIIGKQFKKPTRKISVVERTGVQKVGARHDMCIILAHVHRRKTPSSDSRREILVNCPCFSSLQEFDTLPSSENF